MGSRRHLKWLGNCGNYVVPFSEKSFVFPKFVCRCPDFDNDYLEIENRRSVFKSHRPESKNLRPAFGLAEQFRTSSIGRAKDTTTTKNTDAAALYENVLTIQNAADLEWPATDPANAGVRGQFMLGIFPPDHGGNHTPPPTPPAAPAK